ncbi:MULTISPECIES: chemotaxis protein [unclassified Yoonia]|uniref:chemotaxis protein n=1 Tax=unclassified Yoonia TaxID=2629118 RepID=UPI002AFFD737|nr:MULTISPECIES: chemotaxis protein [unclassified Yoonia]
MKKAPIAPPSDLYALLGNTGTALRRISAVIARLEDASLEQITGGADSHRADQALQDFDLVQQSLSDLAALLDDLGRSGLPAAPQDQQALIAQMRLAWLRDIIGGTAPTPDRGSARIAIF